MLAWYDVTDGKLKEVSSSSKSWKLVVLSFVFSALLGMCFKIM